MGAVLGCCSLPCGGSHCPGFSPLKLGSAGSWLGAVTRKEYENSGNSCGEVSELHSWHLPAPPLPPPLPPTPNPFGLPLLPTSLPGDGLGGLAARKPFMVPSPPARSPPTPLFRKMGKGYEELTICLSNVLQFSWKCECSQSGAQAAGLKSSCFGLQ